MRPVLLLVAAAVLFVAVGAAAFGPPDQDGAPPAAPVTLATAASPSASGPTETVLVLKPGDDLVFRIVADGGPLAVFVRLNHGASLGGTLYAPDGCPDDAFMTTVIGIAYSGQVVAWTKCDVPAGVLEFRVQSGESAFVGSIELHGATFEAA